MTSDRESPVSIWNSVSMAPPRLLKFILPICVFGKEGEASTTEGVSKSGQRERPKASRPPCTSPCSLLEMRLSPNIRTLPRKSHTTNIEVREYAVTRESSLCGFQAAYRTRKSPK
jgi:hypothetical protein